MPGDFDGNGVFDTIDFIKTSTYLFAGVPAPDLICECWIDDPPLEWAVALDVNGNCAVNIADMIFMFEYLRSDYPPELLYCFECPPAR